jgi:hypothetical protein
MTAGWGFDDLLKVRAQEKEQIERADRLQRQRAFWENSVLMAIRSGQTAATAIEIANELVDAWWKREVKGAK